MYVKFQRIAKKFPNYLYLCCTYVCKWLIEKFS